MLTSKVQEQRTQSARTMPKFDQYPTQKKVYLHRSLEILVYCRQRPCELHRNRTLVAPGGRAGGAINATSHPISYQQADAVVLRNCVVVPSLSWTWCQTLKRLWFRFACFFLSNVCLHRSYAVKICREPLQHPRVKQEDLNHVILFFGIAEVFF